MRHKLKILPHYLNDIIYRGKNFELRKDDRLFKIGDEILLQEYNGKEYTGKELLVEIVYILRNCPKYGLKNGYCILGIKEV